MLSHPFPAALRRQIPAHRHFRRCAMALVTLLISMASATAARAQDGSQSKTQPPLVLHAYKLGHQQAIEALPLVYPLLSSRGTLEIKPGENTLVLRDEKRYIDRVVAVLDRFDHPGNPIRVEVRLIEAQSVKFSPGAPSEITGRLGEHLARVMPNHTFRQIATTDLNTHEGESVSYQLAGRFRLEFKVGMVAQEQRLRLHGFQVLRRPTSGAVQKLIHTTLHLRLGQTLYLGLAPSEESREVLMLVISARRDTGSTGER